MIFYLTKTRKFTKKMGIFAFADNNFSMNYKDLLDWLFVQFPSYQKIGDRAYKPGLDAMRAFAAELGGPQRWLRMIHVAGTNGKGSVSSMLAAALAASGMRVGLYTSPHLTDFRERMKIITADGWEMIPEAGVERFLRQWKAYFEEEQLSFFEITTGMAFDWFAREAVDAAVIEVGLGGRLDSTNILMPELSVITNISLEHCQYLGHTLAEVAGEKAGIIKPGIPVVIGEALPETRPVFERVAAENGSPILFAEEAAESFLPVCPEELDLQGDYQARNLRTVDTALSLAAPVFGLHDLALMARGVRRAGAMTGLHGRWETLRAADETRAQLICDAGHNAHAFRWIRAQLGKISCEYEEIVFILGIVADKDLAAISSYLPRDVHYIFTQPSTARALPVAELANLLHESGLNGEVAPTLSDALARAESITGPRDLIFVSGSCYLVSDLLALMA